ncbi:hypothetical protein R1flu_007498 [Riccia fluitans]|uniref:Zinc transporter n=1 Tax=Riccia fluitans TaxID=41844 RepID=A0ABD1YZ12_9MARC
MYATTNVNMYVGPGQAKAAESSNSHSGSDQKVTAQELNGAVFIPIRGPLLEMGDCEGGLAVTGETKDVALRLKGGAIVAIFFASSLGVAIPLLGRKLKWLQVDGNSFLVAKSFASGVILATGFVHILGDATERLTSPCLPEMPWDKFPWAGFIAMMAVCITLVVDVLSTRFFESKNCLGAHAHVHNHTVNVADDSTVATSGSRPIDEETNATKADREKEALHLRYVVISQVLEFGIITHSVIIGISLGVSDSPSTIRPLFAALVFHQFFEGVALGGCIAQAGIKTVTSFVMACFFAMTTPLGIAMGIGISSSYNENSTTALITEGVFDSVSAGILIYLALVDLIAHDFLGDRMKDDRPLQAFCFIGLFTGAIAMAALAVWA